MATYKQAKESAWNRPFLPTAHPLRRNQPSQHLDFGLQPLELGNSGFQSFNSPSLWQV